LRALIELTKMQQANLDDLVLIAVDCAGTYSVPDFQRIEKGNGSGSETEYWKVLFQAASSAPDQPNEDLRPACKVCEQPVYAIQPEKDIAIELFGYDTGQELHVALPEPLAAPISAKLGLADTKEIGGDRASVVERLVAARTTERDAEFTAIRARLEGEEGLAGIFASCIRCHNCMTVCPICYCKQCVFKSAVFDHEPVQFVNWARQKGAFRMPPDTTLFHMTRLNHMSLSCIGCGMCTEACPSELPVGMVFRAIGQRVQAEFAYTPGKSLEDPLPLVTFKADEWEKIGE
jgi:formate dehydrogenase subunit beta